MSIGVIFEDIFCIAILDMMIECQETPYVKDYTCGPPPLDRTAQIYLSSLQRNDECPLQALHP